MISRRHQLVPLSQTALIAILYLGFVLPGYAETCSDYFDGADGDPHAIQVLGATEALQHGESLAIASSVASVNERLWAEAYAFGAILLRPLEQTETVEIDKPLQAATHVQMMLGGPPDNGTERGRLAHLLRSGCVERIHVELAAEVRQQYFDGDGLSVRPGDILFIPERPDTVAVHGRVADPGPVEFDPDATARDYLERAGGTIDGAKPSESFVVLPPGGRNPLHIMAWNYTAESVPPGSVIVVPPWDYWPGTTGRKREESAGLPHQ